MKAEIAPLKPISEPEGRTNDFPEGNLQELCTVAKSSLLVSGNMLFHKESLQQSLLMHDTSYCDTSDYPTPTRRLWLLDES